MNPVGFAGLAVGNERRLVRSPYGVVVEDVDEVLAELASTVGQHQHGGGGSTRNMMGVVWDGADPYP